MIDAMGNPAWLQRCEAAMERVERATEAFDARLTAASERAHSVNDAITGLFDARIETLNAVIELNENLVRITHARRELASVLGDVDAYFRMFDGSPPPNQLKAHVYALTAREGR